VQPDWTGCTASSDCTAFLSYLGAFELFAVQCCADVHFFVVIRTGVSKKRSMENYQVFFGGPPFV
jgi:hypothetical protein